MYQLISETFPISKKKHRCIWCGESIEVGEKYRNEVSKYDVMQNHKWHLECDESSREYFDQEGPEFCPYEHERPASPALNNITESENGNVRKHGEQPPEFEARHGLVPHLRLLTAGQFCWRTAKRLAEVLRLHHDD